MDIFSSQYVTDIHTGLFSLAETPEEILGVLAHEIAHVNERHSLHSMLNTAGTLVLAQVFLGDIEILSGILLEGGIHLLLMKNSRDHETEADFEGFEYLQEAKINPKGLVSFFEKLDNWKPELIEEGEEVMSFMSTHPLSSERVAYLEEKISNNSLENYREIHFDLEAFKKKLEKIHQTKTEDKQEKE